jgi:hypothetical protein
MRLGRVLEAFRSRIGNNIRAATGITVSPAAWTPIVSEVRKVPVRISRALMFNWELAGWLLPMRWFGPLFRRHVVKRVPWEVDKNLARLTSEWVDAIEESVNDLRNQALRWVTQELETLHRLLEQAPDASAGIRDALARLEQAASGQ